MDNLDLEKDVEEFLRSGATGEVVARLRAQYVALIKAHAWDLIVAYSRRIIGKAALPKELVAPYLLALRGSEKHDEALEFIGRARKSNAQTEVAEQRVALYYDISDFKGLISAFEETTSLQDTADASLLTLVAIAHENCRGNEHSRRSLEAYEKVLKITATRSLPKETEEVPLHPGMPSDPKAFLRQRYVESLHLWARKSRGDLLARVEERRPEAKKDWAMVISEAEAQIPSFPHDYYILRLIAWCSYRLGRHDRAGVAYREALQTHYPKYRLQFEFPLVQLAQGRFSNALNQYRKAILDSRDMSPMHQQGLLRSALFYLEGAILEKLELRYRNEIATIVDELENEIQNAFSRINQGLGDIGSRLLNDAMELSSSVKSLIAKSSGEQRAAPEVLNWSDVRIVGVEDPAPSPCGMLFPVLECNGTRFIHSSEGIPDRPSPGLVPLTSPRKAVRGMSFRGTVSPGTRVVYLSEATVRLLKRWAHPLPACGISWGSLEGTDESVVACLDILEASRVLEKLACDFIEISTNELAKMEPEGRATEASDGALLAVYAGRRSKTMYLAALCYRALATDPVDLRIARPDATDVALPENARLQELSRHFSDSIGRIPRSPFAQWSGDMLSAFAKELLNRAKWVSNIADANQRCREAVWAAAEAQVLLVRAAIPEELQAKLVTRLARETKMYLNADGETVVLAQEPAFYCSIQLPVSNKPILDIVSFFKVADLRANDWFEEGPIALAARAS